MRGYLKLNQFVNEAMRFFLAISFSYMLNKAIQIITRTFNICLWLLNIFIFFHQINLDLINLFNNFSFLWKPF